MSSGWSRSTSRLEEARASGTMATRSGRHRDRTTMAAVEDDLTRGIGEEGFEGSIIKLKAKRLTG